MSHNIASNVLAVSQIEFTWAKIGVRPVACEKIICVEGFVVAKLADGKFWSPGLKIIHMVLTCGLGPKN